MALFLSVWWGCAELAASCGVHAGRCEVRTIVTGDGDGASALTLPHIIAAAKTEVLQQVLCYCVEGLPFLLQPLVDAPALMQVRLK